MQGYLMNSVAFTVSWTWYKHSSTVNCKTLLTLNGGGSWIRNFRSYSGHMEHTAFNVTGFIQPSYVHEMLTKAPDADGLNDRQLFDFPPERELYLEELKVPMPSNIPTSLWQYSNSTQKKKHMPWRVMLQGHTQ